MQIEWNGWRAGRGVIAAAALCLAAAGCGDDSQSSDGNVRRATTDVSTSLEAILENGSLAGACDAYRANPTDRDAMLRCGKYMYFYDGLGTPGPPLPILTTLIENLPDFVGPGFRSVGSFLDPYSPQQLPIGFGTAPSYGPVEGRAFTCAACHFGRTEEGVFVVGLPNQEYEYGQTLLYMMLVPTIVSGVEPNPAEKYGPEVLAAVQPALDYLDAHPDKKQAVVDDVVAMVRAIVNSGNQLPSLMVRADAPYWWTTWQPGVLDFFTSPFPEDEVHIPIRIPSLWEIPTQEEIHSLGLRHAMLTAAGGGDTLWSFVRGFVLTSKGDPSQWDDDAIRPLVEYIYSLESPDYRELRGALDRDLIGRGKRLFEQVGCLGCHDGKSYGGKDIYYFGDENSGGGAIGTDRALERFADPDLDGELCCDLVQLGNSELTHGLKAPHLTGIWAHRRYLHNGSVNTLEELLCLDGPRPPSSPIEGMGNGGHLFGCDLDRPEKDALIEFLRSL